VQKAKEQMNIFKQVQGGTPYAHNHNMTLIQMFFFVFSIKLVAYFQVPTSNNFFLVPKFLLKFEIGFGASTHTKAFFFSFFFSIFFFFILIFFFFKKIVFFYFVFFV